MSRPPPPSINTIPCHVTLCCNNNKLPVIKPSRLDSQGIMGFSAMVIATLSNATQCHKDFENATGSLWESAGGLFLRELTGPNVREKDTMMSCCWISKRRGTDTIKEKEIKWRGGSLVVFCPPCGSMRAVIKDWLVVMWSYCHGGLYVSSRHEDQCCRPNEFCSFIYQKKPISFSYLTLPKKLSLSKKKVI